MQSSAAVAQAKYWQLKQMGLFADLDGAAVRRLGERVDTELIEAGRDLYRFGDPAERVYVLKAGRIKVSRASSDGKELILYYVSPGEIFGELAITGGGRRTGTATVVEDAFVCAVAARDFEELLLRHPELALEVTRVIGRRKEHTERRVLELISKDVRGRLAGTLAELARDYGVPDERGVRIELPLTQTDLAQLVGSTRETTSTVINEFRRGGLLETEGKTLWVLDPDALGGYPVDRRARRPGRAA